MEDTLSVQPELFQVFALPAVIGTAQDMFIDSIAIEILVLIGDSVKS